MSTDEWKSISADGAPPGVYVPNMSDADAQTWRAKLTGVRTEPQVEIRKSVGGVNVTLVVGLDGYNYKYYKRNDERWPTEGTRGLNVHVAMNGPLRLTFDAFHTFTDELDSAVREAHDVLLKLTQE